MNSCCTDPCSVIQTGCKMSEAISKAEVQLCMAAKNIRQPTFSQDALRGFGELAFKDELQDWSKEFERLLALKVFRADGDKYSLTESGQAYVEKIIANEFFGSMLLRAERSKTFAEFCERVYGKNLTQFGTTDMEELNQLIAVLKLNENSQVLDLGCGIGAVAEYISDETGAHFTAIDSAENVIARAAERTKDKAHRLQFLVGDINKIDFPPASFDTVIAIDTLYFAKDLVGVIGQLKTLLKAGGQMGVFYSDVITPADSPELLNAEQTKLARALKANDLGFASLDLNDSNKAFWQRSVEVAKELQPAFIAEGNKDLAEGRIVEGSAVLGLANAGRMCRYLYHVSV